MKTKTKTYAIGLINGLIAGGWASFVRNDLLLVRTPEFNKERLIVDSIVLIIILTGAILNLIGIEFENEED